MDFEREQLGKVITNIREKQPIVFHITNTVTINDCANITLAIGASPLMSFCEDELEDILSFASSLVLNIGTMDKSMREMAVKAGQIANKFGKPVVLDPVGVGATKARKELVEKLLSEVHFAVIKGNMAEIKSIYGIENSTNRGVDSIEDLENGTEIAIALAKRYDTIIAITGKQDIISDGHRIAKINNGTPILGKVTGTGCMTASLIGSACGANRDYFTAATTAVTMMGIAGEKAEEHHSAGGGNGTIRIEILDTIYNMTSDRFNESEKVELL